MRSCPTCWCHPRQRHSPVLHCPNVGNGSPDLRPRRHHHRPMMRRPRRRLCPSRHRPHYRRPSAAAADVASGSSARSRRRAYYASAASSSAPSRSRSRRAPSTATTMPRCLRRRGGGGGCYFPLPRRHWHEDPASAIEFRDRQCHPSHGMMSPARNRHRLPPRACHRPRQLWWPLLRHYYWPSWDRRRRRTGASCGAPSRTEISDRTLSSPSPPSSPWRRRMMRRVRRRSGASS
mmetsp:Transcript_10779/g.26620  ORF Transcript_10779/g.26620 Transcript_10779/m.26620 type:complete len:234 (+) Transcript_10779:638-1339(+)